MYVTQDCCSSESGLCMASATIHGAKHGVRKSLLSSRLFSWLTVSWSSQTPQVNTQEELFTNAGPSKDKSLSDEIGIPQHNATPIFLNWPPLAEFTHILVATEGQAMSSLMLIHVKKNAFFSLPGGLYPHYLVYTGHVAKAARHLSTSTLETFSTVVHLEGFGSIFSV